MKNNNARFYHCLSAGGRVATECLFAFGIIVLAATTGMAAIIWNTVADRNDSPNEYDLTDLGLDNLRLVDSGFDGWEIRVDNVGAIEPLAIDSNDVHSGNSIYFGAGGCDAHPTGSGATFGTAGLGSLPEIHVGKRKKRGGGSGGGGGGANGGRRGANGSTSSSDSGTGGSATFRDGLIGNGRLLSEGEFSRSGLIPDSGSLGMGSAGWGSSFLGESIPRGAMFGEWEAGTTMKFESETLLSQGHWDALALSRSSSSDDGSYSKVGDLVSSLDFLGLGLSNGEAAGSSSRIDSSGAINPNRFVNPEPGSLLIWCGLGAGAILIRRRMQRVTRPV